MELWDTVLRLTGNHIGASIELVVDHAELAHFRGQLAQ